MSAAIKNNTSTVTVSDERAATTEAVTILDVAAQKTDAATREGFIAGRAEVTEAYQYETAAKFAKRAVSKASMLRVLNMEVPAGIAAADRHIRALK